MTIGGWDLGKMYSEPHHKNINELTEDINKILKESLKVSQSTPLDSFTKHLQNKEGIPTNNDRVIHTYRHCPTDYFLEVQEHVSELRFLRNCGKSEDTPNIIFHKRCLLELLIIPHTLQIYTVTGNEPEKVNVYYDGEVKDTEFYVPLISERVKFETSLDERVIVSPESGIEVIFENSRSHKLILQQSVDLRYGHLPLLGKCSSNIIIESPEEREFMLQIEINRLADTYFTSYYSNSIIGGLGDYNALEDIAHMRAFGMSRQEFWEKKEEFTGSLLLKDAEELIKKICEEGKTRISDKDLTNLAKSQADEIYKQTFLFKKSPLITFRNIRKLSESGILEEKDWGDTLEFIGLRHNYEVDDK